MATTRQSPGRHRRKRATLPLAVNDIILDIIVTHRAGAARRYNRRPVRHICERVRSAGPEGEHDPSFIDIGRRHQRRRGLMWHQRCPKLTSPTCFARKTQKKTKRRFGDRVGHLLPAAAAARLSLRPALCERRVQRALASRSAHSSTAAASAVVAAAMDSSKSSDGTTKKNLPLLRAVKEGKLQVITSLLESNEVNVNFQNHCALARPDSPSLRHSCTHANP